MARAQGSKEFLFAVSGIVWHIHVDVSASVVAVAAWSDNGGVKHEDIHGLLQPSASF